MVEREKETSYKIIDALKLVSPGTVLRTAMDDILRAGMGALIVVDSPGLKDIMEGGFKINSKLTYQRIVELAKMDAAIILSSDLKKILYSNVLLVPQISIPTNETGTRHKAAERTARQTGSLAIAISERRKKITIYYGKLKYILRDTGEILSRAVETLQILEKQREILDELMSNLNVLEISGLVVASDVCSVLQRMELMMRAAKTIERYLIELGKEGVIIRMRLKELLKNIDKEKTFILKDYDSSDEALDDFSLDDLLETEKIANILFSKSGDDKVYANGYRILNKLSLDKKQVLSLVTNFQNLSKILDADEGEIRGALGDDAEKFKNEIISLKEQIMMVKKI